MYPHAQALKTPDKPAIVMAGSGETITYGELERRSNRLAHLIRSLGLQRLDHYSVFMENHPRYAEVCVAGERTGQYYTCINSFLTADELTYILDNSQAQLLITSVAKLDVARQALARSPRIKLCLVIGGNPAGFDDPRLKDYESAVAAFPDTPVADERLGTSMLYSSGTTGRPKGVQRPVPDEPPGFVMPLFGFLQKLWRGHEGVVHLSPAPLYHAAPLAHLGVVLRSGGTAVIMEHFDAEQFLALVEKHRINSSQLVPTMFSRMLKLPDDVRRRYDLSSLKFVVHAAAPCPVQVKEQMIAWWGPIVHEYYGATEGLGFAACDSAEWLAHRGTVGKVLMGELHILDEQMKPVPKGQSGEIWFRPATEFAYFNDAERTAQARSADGQLCTVGDVGYVDDDGFLYLTDRSTFMIISGGVNIYPQECENLLITHPKVADAAVFGVPNEDLGEEVKAVVQLMPGVPATPETAAELTAFCGQHLARQKVPRSIDFMDQLPRLPTGKLYKKPLRERYWAGHKSRIV
ncbi:MAG: AMP-binding protein [Rubrivivax sp.]|nr:AMP-binding protein [Rubrivivax sp.]